MQQSVFSKTALVELPSMRGKLHTKVDKVPVQGKHVQVKNIQDIGGKHLNALEEEGYFYLESYAKWKDEIEFLRYLTKQSLPTSLRNYRKIGSLGFYLWQLSLSF